MRTALITGASGGIGLELARVFAQKGWNLVLIARSGAKLDPIARELEKKQGIRSAVIPKDLAMPDSSREIFEETEKKGIQVDALVNNAGVGSFGPFAAAEPASDDRQIALNIAALTQLSKYYIRPMIARKTGYILNVASTAAFQPGPLMAVYYASKAYVLSFSEALANETEGTGVTVAALCPGATLTGFQEAANMTHSKLFKRRVLLTARRVAEEGYKGLMAGKTVVIPGLSHRLMVSAVRFFPRKWVTRIVRKIQEAE